MNYLHLYLLIINAVCFLLMHADKEKAKAGRWRIPESTLLGAAFIGGSLGAYIGMRIFRHKTRHPKFSVGLPCLITIHAALYAFFLCQ